LGSKRAQKNKRAQKTNLNFNVKGPNVEAVKVPYYMKVSQQS
jgi:hypothetical protein